VDGRTDVQAAVTGFYKVHSVEEWT